MLNKKVCILSSVHSALDVRIFHKEAKTLVTAGYDVTLVARHDRDSMVDGIKIIALPIHYNRFQRMICTTFHIFRLALKERPNIYHFHDPELIFVCFLLKLVTHRKIIYDVHEDVPAQILTKSWVPFYIRVIASKIMTFSEKLGLSFFDVIIVAGRDITKHFPCSNNIVILNNFPLLKSLNIKKKKRDKVEEITLVYAGVLTRDRGIKEMIDSIKYIENVKLLLVGSFDVSLFESEIKKIATQKVKFIGKVSYDKVFHYLAEADIGMILLHPTPNNIAGISGRNNKIFEYMGMGLPIVASNLPGWKEVIEDGGYGITVNPLNPKEIAKGIEWLIKHPKEAGRMGENGRKAVLKKYNWENESKKLLKVYEELCEK